MNDILRTERLQGDSWRRGCSSSLLGVIRTAESEPDDLRSANGHKHWRAGRLPIRSEQPKPWPRASSLEPRCEARVVSRAQPKTGGTSSIAWARNRIETSNTDCNSPQAVRH